VKTADGGSAPRTIYKGRNFAGPESWSPDGQSIAFSMQSMATKSFDIGIVPAAGGPLRILLASAGNERGAAFSPDGRWLAYISDESGRTELYVTRYPEGGAKWQVSSRGVFVSGATSLVTSWWSSRRDHLCRPGPARLRHAGEPIHGASIRAQKTSGPSSARAADYCPALHRLLMWPRRGSRGQPLTLVTNWAASLPR
jgi:dipeptidyl aminopeptidase/acylaminoacyl peptidase